MLTSHANINLPIPIVILHRNEFNNLFQMIDSIISHTAIAYKLFVVDNQSSVSDKTTQIARLKKIQGITVIESEENNWVLGFNKALSHPTWPTDSQYFVFSDADIVLPEKHIDGACWLEEMIVQMDKHACIGKLGISLRTDDIDNPIVKELAIKQNCKYHNSPKIGENAIAIVDTTLAIYRPDFFIFKNFAFSVGHASLARPHYYTCRTSDAISARHLGWYNDSSLKLDSLALSEKIRCFAKFCGGIEPNVLMRSSIKDRLFYRLIYPFSRIFWGAKVAINQFFYLARRFPRDINELQSKYR